MLIANPIYDVVFKYLMADMSAAKCLLSALLGDEVEIVELLPQEHSIILPGVHQLSVVRFDYRATLSVKGQLKKVLIELQKNKSSLDVSRFRRYLGTNYSNTDTVNGTQEILPIIAIYLFGFNMNGIEPAITRFHPQGMDILEGIPIEPEQDVILESLTHTCYFVQLPKLPTKHQKRVGRVLSVFSQHWITDKDRLRLNLPDELKHDKALLPLIERLEHALLDNETRRQVTEEDAFEVTVNNSLHEAEAKGKIEGAHEKALQTACQMKADGLPISKIKHYTGLKESDIEAL